MRQIDSMVAEPQAKGRIFTTEERRAGQLSTAKLRRSPVTNIVAMQQVLMQRVINADPDARDVATCACAWDKLEERRREALGKARLAPVKAESKRSRSGPRLHVEPVESPPAATS